CPCGRALTHDTGNRRGGQPTTTRPLLPCWLCTPAIASRSGCPAACAPRARLTQHRAGKVSVGARVAAGRALDPKLAASLREDDRRLHGCPAGAGSSTRQGSSRGGQSGMRRMTWFRDAGRVCGRQLCWRTWLLVAAALVADARPAPAMQLAFGSYTGDGQPGRAIAAVGFAPDAVIIKGNTAQGGVMRTATMTGDANQEL